MPQSTTRTEIETFETKVATLFAGFAAEDSLDKSGLSRSLSAVGIKADVVATGAELKISVQIPEHPGVPAGTDAGDLKDAALNRHAADYLRARRQSVWTKVKSMSEGSTLTSERAMSVLRGLGYGDASLPSYKTTVSADIQRDRNAGYDSISFTLDGEFTKDAVAEKLTSVAPVAAARTLAAQAFPTAVFAEDSAPVRNLHVTGRLTWPAKSEFHAA